MHTEWKFKDPQLWNALNLQLVQFPTDILCIVYYYCTGPFQAVLVHTLQNPSLEISLNKVESSALNFSDSLWKHPTCDLFLSNHCSDHKDLLCPLVCSSQEKKLILFSDRGWLPLYFLDFDPMNIIVWGKNSKRLYSIDWMSWQVQDLGADQRHGFLKSVWKCGSKLIVEQGDSFYVFE